MAVTEAPHMGTHSDSCMWAVSCCSSQEPHLSHASGGREEGWAVMQQLLEQERRVETT